MFDTYISVSTTDRAAAIKQDAASEAEDAAALIFYRTADGSHNNLKCPFAGMSGTRFGRNFPLNECYPDDIQALMQPNPRTVSRKLMAKKGTSYHADIINILAVGWIQFQVHDWFNHGRDKDAEPYKLKAEDGDDWHEPNIKIPPTPADPTRTADDDRNLPPTYVNTESHWWDGSNIYGSDFEILKQLRTFKGGKLNYLEDTGLPIDEETGLPKTGFTENWWLGLSLLHEIFTKEHNSICDMLASANPAWSDERLFQTARLINCALMAKIHTVEWTPAILPNSTVHMGMMTNWYGLVGERVAKIFGRVSDSEMISGIMGSSQSDHGVPYSLTEEFCSVYRLHSLIPDSISFYSHANGSDLGEHTFKDVSLSRTMQLLNNLSREDCLYSLGIGKPGAMVLHNYPDFLRKLELPDGEILDLAATDIFRDRERGIPRYNRFRTLLHKKKLSSIDELTSDPVLRGELKEVYNDDIDAVDLQIGLLAEEPPPGFGFSETAFRIFVLMASRRLNADRFFTDDFTPEVYTCEGLDWIKNNTMKSLLVRHYPGLALALKGIDNAFKPWNNLSQAWIVDKQGERRLAASQLMAERRSSLRFR